MFFDYPPELILINSELIAGSKADKQMQRSAVFCGKLFKQLVLPYRFNGIFQDIVVKGYHLFNTRSVLMNAGYNHFAPVDTELITDIELTL